jgi:DNA polymerase III subunit delta'
MAEHNGWPSWVDESAAERLRQPIREERLGHAYLIYGPNGVGKSPLAHAFARALCCANPSPDDPSQACGHCRPCRNVDRDSHPDVEVFSLDSEARLGEKSGRGNSLSIDTVRRLRASVSLLPLESRRRILIIEDAETLLEPAQQALLKVLEEPPASVILLLLVDEPESLLTTVRSRCQEIAVRPVSPASIERHLLEQGVEQSIAAEIASLSHGCPAWALAAASDAKVLRIRRNELEAARSWLTATPYDRLVTAYKLGTQYPKRRAETVHSVQSVIALLREEMLRLAKPTDAPPATAVPPLFEREVSAASVARAASASLQCLEDLERNVRPRLALETMVVTWPNPASQLS